MLAISNHFCESSSVSRLIPIFIRKYSDTDFPEKSYGAHSILLFRLTRGKTRGYNKY